MNGTSWSHLNKQVDRVGKAAGRDHTAWGPYLPPLIAGEPVMPPPWIWASSAIPSSLERELATLAEPEVAQVVGQSVARESVWAITLAAVKRVLQLRTRMLDFVPQLAVQEAWDMTRGMSVESRGVDG